ncbi:hypothetical protein ABKN59_010044 [Abortiporus biennis]
MFEDIAAVLHAAAKYDMERPVAAMARALKSECLQTHTLQVYGCACQHKLEDVACEAAQVWRKRMGNWSNSFLTTWDSTTIAHTRAQGLETISAGSYYRLLEYLRTGILPNKFTEPDVISSKKPLYVAPPETSMVSFFHLGVNCLEDIKIRSADGIEFLTHRTILYLASPVLSDMITTAMKDDNTSGCVELLVTIDLPEDSRDLAHFLPVCYPGGFLNVWPDIEFDVLCTVLQMAETYKATTVTSLCKLKLKRFLQSHPIDVYLVSYQYRFGDVAEEAAVVCARSSTAIMYGTRMEKMPAKSFISLLKFTHQYRGSCAIQANSGLIEHYWMTAAGPAFHDLHGSSINPNKSSALVEDSIYLYLDQISGFGYGSSDTFRRHIAGLTNVIEKRREAISKLALEWD